MVKESSEPEKQKKSTRNATVKVFNLIKSKPEMQEFISWTKVVDWLIAEFGWSPKTCSNRLHELIELGLLERRGDFQRPNRAIKTGVDKREIKLVRRDSR